MRLNPSSQRQRRSGSIVPLLGVTIIAVLALIALAVDIGMVALARNHAQNVADTAALSGVRTLDGNKANNNNYSAVDPAAKSAAKANKVLGQAVTDSMVTTEIGWYTYNKTLQRFESFFTGSKPATESWTAVRATVTSSSPMFFGKIFSLNTPMLGSNPNTATSIPTGATATSVHRPRDVALILDFSGSMKFSSELGWPSSGDYSGSLNPDSAYPKFGHYSNMASVMRRTSIYVDSGGEAHAPNNLTVETQNGPPIVMDFLTRAGSGALTNAFFRPTTPYSPTTWACPAPLDWDVQSDTTETYVGDKWPRYNKSFTTGSYARTVYNYLLNTDPTYASDHNKSTATGPGGSQFDPVNPSTPTNNEGYGPNFKGFVMGPGYYGKSFFYWPPDPRFHPSAATATPDPANPAKDTSGRWMGDWRKRFFTNGTGTTAPLNGDNSRLWDTGTEQWKQAGSTTYGVNYNAIIAWIKSGPQVLPANLRSGRLLYYSAIPDTIPSTGGTEDQRFWRSYIDYVVGNGSNTTQKQIGYGRQPDGDTTFGTPRITARASINGADGIVGNSDDPYMNYSDNPVRPRLQFWFGPLTMMCFLSDNNGGYTRNWWSGTTHEAQCWQLKAGVNSALADIEKNHPNDMVALMFFSDIATYATPRVNLGRDYQRMKNALFFPFSLLDSLTDPNAEVRPYNSSYSSTASGNVPNALGGTGPELGFKLAYNQFSGASGYNGRRGATKMVIFETDGVPNTRMNDAEANTNLVLGTPPAYNSYYSSAGLAIGPFDGNNDPGVISRALTVVQTICNKDTANPPGYATPRTPVYVHALAFGDLFQSGSSRATQALDFLLNVEKIGSTSAATATSIDSYKIITGDYNTRIENLRQAFERIMQSGVQVTLIK